MDTVTVERRSAIMRQIRSKNTRPELLVRRLIYSLGYRYRLHRPDLPGKPDLVFAGRKKVIFIHGCFWHAHAKCSRARMPNTNPDYWVKKIARNVERDKNSSLKLESAGWKVLIVWECELRRSARLEEKIKEFLNG